MIWVDFKKDHQSASAGDWLCMFCEKLCVFCGTAERESDSTRAFKFTNRYGNVIKEVESTKIMPEYATEILLKIKIVQMG
jgi:hypothetical protein